ncbi:MAG TPA: hypothetical protein VK543_02255 [Puia sp.]|nr:hypothetical protein [Puia sp.]
MEKIKIFTVSLLIVFRNSFMKKIIIVFLLTLTIHAANAQRANSGIAGEYYLRGVMETASGFQLNPDSSFNFFYSYGALDRFGTGRWSVQNDQIVILNSRQRPAVDFKLIESRVTADDSITIIIKDNNNALLHYVQCRIQTRTGIKELTTNQEGIARFAKEPADSLALLFILCPDRFSSFAISDKQNYFVFGFEPWVVEVFFDHFPLLFEKNQLSGGHPLLEGTRYRYERAQKGSVKEQ